MTNRGEVLPGWVVSSVGTAGAGLGSSSAVVTSPKVVWSPTANVLAISGEGSRGGPVVTLDAVSLAVAAAFP